ncbi:MAG: DUF21 domain-containing protein [Fidelibacterota bacterium]|nr:MAG: DUF21 domain-containing protein [Candidatus Neomarinimicrobiota bacterium]
MEIYVWLGIAFCISQSAIFSGLNLAVFSISRLRLEVEASQNNRNASKILALRSDANFLLTTILWGNVGINVLLTLLSNSVLAGVMAFIFSTVLITFLGEIVPQAYFSRHALQTASLLTPLLRFYQFVLFPVAKPTAWLLNLWLGHEGIAYFKEQDFQELLKIHMEKPSTEIDHVEGRGALNFLAIDDLSVSTEGEPIDPDSILQLSIRDNQPEFPSFEGVCTDTFLQKVHAPDKKWMIIIDDSGEPHFVLNSDSFLRAGLFERETFQPLVHCHRPIIVRDAATNLGDIILQLKVYPDRPGDDVIDRDIILVWAGDVKRVITGADILGRLMRGIAQQEQVYFSKHR